jgi:hypothetical protein
MNVCCMDEAEWQSVSGSSAWRLVWCNLSVLLVAERQHQAVAETGSSAMRSQGLVGFFVAHVMAPSSTRDHDEMLPDVCPKIGCLLIKLRPCRKEPRP